MRQFNVDFRFSDKQILRTKPELRPNFRDQFQFDKSWIMHFTHIISIAGFWLIFFLLFRQSVCNFFLGTSATVFRLVQSAHMTVTEHKLRFILPHKNSQTFTNLRYLISFLRAETETPPLFLSSVSLELLN